MSALCECLGFAQTCCCAAWGLGLWVSVRSGHVVRKGHWDLMESWAHTHLSLLGNESCKLLLCLCILCVWRCVFVFVFYTGYDSLSAAKSSLSSFNVVTDAEEMCRLTLLYLKDVMWIFLETHDRKCPLSVACLSLTWAVSGRQPLSVCLPRLCLSLS